MSHLKRWILLPLLLLASTAFAASVNLGWDASPDPVNGYRLYRGTASHQYTVVTPISGRTTTAATVTGLTDGTLYFFALTAVYTVNNLSVEGGFSSEITYQPQVASTPTPTPAPTDTPSPTPTDTPSPSPSATAGPSPTPTPAGVTISGRITSCSSGAPAPGLLIGTDQQTTVTDQDGRYALIVQEGATVTVAPQLLPPLPPASHGIDTVDVIGLISEFLQFGMPACPAAADVNGDGVVDTIDAIAVQRFALGFQNGYGVTGGSLFTPTDRVYEGVIEDQTDQDFALVIMGDVE
jgi:hypothetical protein